MSQRANTKEMLNSECADSDLHFQVITWNSSTKHWFLSVKPGLTLPKHIANVETSFHSWMSKIFRHYLNISLWHHDFHCKSLTLSFGISCFQRMVTRYVLRWKVQNEALYFRWVPNEPACLMSSETDWAAMSQVMPNELPFLHYYPISTSVSVIPSELLLLQ